MYACGEFVNGCRLARQVRKAERVEARAQRKEAKLVNKATKAVMSGNITKASKLQMRANEMHAQAEFAHETREGALNVMAGSSVPMVQKLGSYVAQPKRRCCGMSQAAPLRSQTLIIGGDPQPMYGGTVIETKPGLTGPVAYPTGPVAYPTGPVVYPPQEKYLVDGPPPAYVAAPGDQYMTKTPPPAYMQ